MIQRISHIQRHLNCVHDYVNCSSGSSGAWISPVNRNMLQLFIIKNKNIGGEEAMKFCSNLLSILSPGLDVPSVGTSCVFAFWQNSNSLSSNTHGPQSSDSHDFRLNWLFYLFLEPPAGVQFHLFRETSYHIWDRLFQNCVQTFMVPSWLTLPTFHQAPPWHWH